MQRILIALFALLICSQNLLSQAHDQGELTPQQKTPLLEYLRKHWQSPDDYIVSKFRDRDVVLLAETHGIKHNLELVQRLIPQLYKAGVYNVGMEFGAQEDQQELDRLINAPEYDDAIARRLMYSYNVGWAYIEYREVYRKAWEFNRTLPKGAPRFRIVNLSYKYDWSNLHGPRTPYSMRKVYSKGNIEEFRAGVVEREVFKKHQKMLVITGTIHAFTKYVEPEYDYSSPGFLSLRAVTLGNLLEKRHPGQNFTIMLHVPWDSQTRPAQCAHFTESLTK